MGGTAGPVPIVKSVEPGSIAARAGLEPGQEIVAIDGEETPTWQALNWRLAGRLGDTGTIEFSVRYPDSDLEYHMAADIDRWLSGGEVPDPMEEAGLELWTPPITMKLSRVVPGSAADRAGLRAGAKSSPPTAANSAVGILGLSMCAPMPEKRSRWKWRGAASGCCCR